MLKDKLVDIQGELEQGFGIYVELEDINKEFFEELIEEYKKEYVEELSLYKEMKPVNKSFPESMLEQLIKLMERI